MKILFLSLFTLLLVALSSVVVIAADPVTLDQTVYMTADGVYKVTTTGSTLPAGSVALASIFVNFSVNATGWDTVHITGDAMALANNYTNAYYGGGFAEGYATWEAILCNNYSSQGPPLTGGAGKWLEENIKWFSNYATNIPASAHPELLRPVASLYHQQIGLRDGINAAIDAAGSSAQKWTLRDTYSLNLQAELPDVEIAGPAQFPQFEDPKNPSQMDMKGATLVPLEKTRALRAVLNGGKSELGFQRRGYGSHCSSLIRVTDDDIFYSHDTWSGYASLGPRQFKIYNFENGVSFSGYPGQTSSIDDWYQTSNGLGVMETTIEQLNVSLTTTYVVPQSLPVFIRVMIANFWSTDSWEWANTFLKFNSGGYCSEWQPFNMKLVTPENLHNLPAGTLVVCDQLPGPYSACEDMTPRLNAEGFFPSYNIPAIKSVFNISGNLNAQEQYGNFFSYNKYARAEIFARNATKVQTLADMQDLMRMNRWTVDPLAEINPQVPCTGCNPSNNPQLAIANRADLVPVGANFGNLSAMSQGFFSGAAFGAIDTKVSSYKMFDLATHTFKSSMISGPSTSNGFLPPFSWSTTNYSNGTRHRGQVNVFDFDFASMTVVMDRTLPLPTAAPSAPSTMTLESFAVIAQNSSITSYAIDGNVAYIGTGNAQQTGVYKLYLDSLTVSPILKIPATSFGIVKPNSNRAYFVTSPATFGGAQAMSFNPQVYELDISTITPTVVSTREIFHAENQIVPTALFDFEGGYQYYSVGTNCFIGAYAMGFGDINGFATNAVQPCISLSIATLTVAVTNNTADNRKYLFALPACYGYGGQGQQVGTGCTVMRMYWGKNPFYESVILPATGIPPNFGSGAMQIANNILCIVGGKSFTKVDAISMQILGIMSTISNLNAPLTLDNSGFYAYVGTIGNAYRTGRAASVVRVNLLNDVPSVDSIYTDVLPGSPVAFTTAFTIVGSDNKINVFFFGGPIANTNLGSIVNATMYKISAPQSVAPPSTTAAPFTPAPEYINNGTYFNLIYKGVYWPTKDFVNKRLSWFLCNNSILDCNSVTIKVLGNMSYGPPDVQQLSSNAETTHSIYFRLEVDNSIYLYSLQQSVNLLKNSNQTLVAEAFGATEFTSLEPTSTTPAPGSNNGGVPSSPADDKKAAMIGGIVGAVFVVVVVLGIGLWYKNKNRANNNGDSSGPNSVRAELVGDRTGEVQSHYRSADEAV